MGLELQVYHLEGSTVCDLRINLGQEVKAVAQTDDSAVSQVNFKWLKEGQEAREVTVPISVGEDKFAPDEPGDWLVIAEFDSGERVGKTLRVDFFVLPESPVGAVAMVLTSLGALGAFLYTRSRKPSI